MVNWKRLKCLDWHDKLYVLQLTSLKTLPTIKVVWFLSPPQVSSHQTRISRQKFTWNIGYHIKILTCNWSEIKVSSKFCYLIPFMLLHWLWGEKETHEILRFNSGNPRAPYILGSNEIEHEDSIWRRAFCQVLLQILRTLCRIRTKAAKRLDWRSIWEYSYAIQIT